MGVAPAGPAPTNEASQGLSICNVVDIEKSVCHASVTIRRLVVQVRDVRGMELRVLVLNTRVEVSEIGSRQSLFFSVVFFFSFCGLTWPGS